MAQHKPAAPMRTGEGRGRQGLLQAMANQMEAVRALRHTTSARRFQGDLQQAGGMPENKHAGM